MYNNSNRTDMKQRALIQLVILFTAPLLLSGSLSHGSTLLQRELGDLTKRGFTYRWLSTDLIELKIGRAHV